MDNRNYLLGRQPILNRGEELVAYELLFRSSEALTAVVNDASEATASVVVNTLTGFGIEQILGDHRGFINVELELLMDDSLTILPKTRIVLELLETLQMTPELVERCSFLKENGFSLALDDHVYHPDYHELYQMVDIVKIDLPQHSLEQLPEMVKQFEPYGLQLLAEKVETQEEFKHCLNLGFDLFQGYYFAKPSVLMKKRLDASGSTLLKLMRLLNEDADLRELERIFYGDPGLTYKLLLLVNSVGVGLRSKVDTVSHAIAVVGRQQIKRWIQLVLLAGGDRRGMESPLVDLAAVRAGFMESMIARHHTMTGISCSGEQAFMTGILSVLEKIYDIPMEEVVRHLSLADEVTDALTVRKGGLGRLLHVAELLEEMDFDHLGTHLGDLGVSLHDVLLGQEIAFKWRKDMAC